MTGDVAAGKNRKDARRLLQHVWTAAQRRLDMLQVPKTLADLQYPR